MRSTISFSNLPLVIALLMPLSSFAGDPDYEREILSGIKSELEYLMKRVALAEQQQPQNNRYRFRYDSLSKDLESITLGISEYLGKPQSIPREVKPLIKEYVD